jgi:hypothetical protein
MMTLELRASSEDLIGESMATKVRDANCMTKSFFRFRGKRKIQPI